MVAEPMILFTQHYIKKKVIMGLAPTLMKTFQWGPLLLVKK
jgi:hypothetical protein